VTEVKPILTPTTILLLAVRQDRPSGVIARDPLARRAFGNRALVIAAVLAVVIAALIAAAPAAHPDPAAAVPAAAAAGTDRPDIVLILTDDQRFDTLWAMPTVQSELVAKGIEFTNGFVSNPVCCPSRSSILTGKYSHSTGVYTNQAGQHGGFPAFHDRSTVATWLDDGGYRTALIGKYLNHYSGTYTPPGWDHWFVSFKTGAFYDYKANSNGVVKAFGSDPQDYGTDVLARRATAFIRSTSATQPLFLYFAPHAPHGPAIPGPGDETAFSKLDAWRPPSYNEARVADKPSYIKDRPSLPRSSQRAIDRFRLNQYRSLLAVDRAVASILDALRDTGRLSNALIVFMSDNGMLWGEHRWHSKFVPYEESIRVPFVIRDDALIASPRTDGHLVLNIDLAPTFAAVAGTGAPNVEGRSLLPLLSSAEAPWRSDFLVEHLATTDDEVPTYCGVRAEGLIYVDYGTGEEELYDLVRDPLELTNRAKDPAYRDERRALRSRLVQLCRPRPPGFSFSFG
jgi:N-acetylglucosamine-6-sulfatase